MRLLDHANSSNQHIKDAPPIGCQIADQIHKFLII
jgi:hypothetical protein